MSAAACKKHVERHPQCPFDEQTVHNLTAFAGMLDDDGMKNMRAVVDFGGTLRQAKTVGTGVVVVTLLGAAARALWVGIKHFAAEG